MDKEKILRLCDEIEDNAKEIRERTVKNSYFMAQTIINRVLVIRAEITAPPKNNDEHTAAYRMQKTMDAAHEAYDKLKDTVDFKDAIAEAEAIKQRMGIGETKKITNGDKIRAMTDDELAKFIMDVTDCCANGFKCGDCPLSGVGSCSEKEFAIYFGLEAE